jgi:hypothetical protein
MMWAVKDTYRENETGQIAWICKVNGTISQRNLPSLFRTFNDAFKVKRYAVERMAIDENDLEVVGFQETLL